MTLRTTALLLALMLVWCTAPAGAAFFVVDDFQDGTTQGWRHGGQSPNPPVNVADGGPNGIGDNYLFVETSGDTTSAPGSHLITFNISDWSGDYTGLPDLQFDAINLSATEDLHIRIGIAGPGGVFASTNSSQLTTGSGWQPQVFSLDSADFTASVDGGLFGPGVDINATLSDVAQLRIMSSAGVDFMGDIIDAEMGLDNIVLVPEPTAAVLVGLALIGWGWLRRR